MNSSSHSTQLSFLESLIQQSPEQLDLTNEAHAQLVDEMVDRLLAEGLSLPEIEALESQLIAESGRKHIFLLLAMKVAKSYLLAKGVDAPLSISVVFAVYKEHNRIRPNSEHPHGENFLVKKVQQLDRLFAANPHVKWEIVVVDDGCPEGSGKIAQEIIAQQGFEDRARVLFLADAIEQQLPPANTLASTKDSMKGGSIVYGMWDAVQQGQGDNQVVIFTDADLSTHLGQVMLLAEPLRKGEKQVAIGSRREPHSVVIKKGSRNNRGKLFIYLWKRLIPNLGEIIDTQCGFKAFRADLLSHLIEDMIEKKFAFDIELLVKAELKQPQSVVKIPIAWIDSEAASTTTDLQPYLPMLQSIVKMSRKYFPEKQDASEFADMIEGWEEANFQAVLENIPAGIVSREPIEFIEFNGVSAAEIAG
ncbi:MAG: glycosyltransferase [Bacteroidota bacterium]